MSAYDVFLSYASADKAAVEALAYKLRDEEELRVFLDAWELVPGAPWQDALEEALTASLTCAVFLGPQGFGPWHSQEMRAALDQRDEKERKRVIPVLLPGASKDAVPRFLAGRTAVDFRGGLDDETAFARLVAGIRGVAPVSTPPPAPDTETTASGTLPAICNVPHLRNPHFTGRDDLLDRLHRTLTSARPAALTQTLRGLGGVGKTQTALEYLYRHAADYDVVWWVAAEEQSTLGRDLAALAAELKLVAKGARDQEAAVAAARRWLEGHARWLLVFDNAEDPAALRDILPRGGAGHAIITSRRSDWGSVGSLAVEPFERPDSVRFLESRGAGSETPAAGELAEVLGDLPLALEQAAAYLEETGIAAGRYLELFRKRRRDLLARGVPEGHDAAATTWDLSFETLEADTPAAAALLRLLAFLAPDDLPRGLLAERAGKLPEPLSSAAADPLALLDAVAAARRLSLLEADRDALSMHRLVQAIARDRCDDAERRLWSKAAVAFLNAAYRYDEYDLDTWELAGRLLPHVQAAVSRLETVDSSKPAARLLNETGLYLLDRGALGEARRHLESSLEIAEGVYGPDANEVAIRANNIALILKHQGDLGGALDHARRALQIQEAVYGKEHPNVAIDANNIATILQDQGDLDGALDHARQALRIDEAAYGKEHPNVARDANNIAAILQDQGDLDGALDHARRALRIQEAVYGEEHPNVAIGANNIGLILKAQGDLDGALDHARRALEIDEAVYGKEHPDVAIVANNLGKILKAQGDLDGALDHARRALRIDEAVYGKEHPNVAIRANDIGLILKAQGDLDGAREHVERALSIFERVYGPDHPFTVKVRYNLASLPETG